VVSTFFVIFDLIIKKTTMRLTVHVENAKKITVEKNTKDGPVRKKCIFNTLSFSDVSEGDVSRILSSIEEDGHGTPVKHYLSNEKIKGTTSL